MLMLLWLGCPERVELCDPPPLVCNAGRNEDFDACDACGVVWNCYNSYPDWEPRWIRTGWDCECINDEGHVDTDELCSWGY